MGARFYSDIDLSKVQEIFRQESIEMLRRGENALLELEKTPDSKHAIQAVFRIAHSIKGNASTVGYNQISEFAHRFEDLLDTVRRGRVQVTPELVDHCLHFIDALGGLVRASEKGEPEFETRHRDLLNSLDKWIVKDNGDEPIDTADQYLITASEDNTTEYRSQQPALGLKRRTIRIPVDRLDQLMNLVGEISIARGQITDILEAQNNGEADKLLEIHRESDFLYMGLQELAMKLRTVPIAPLFDGFHRTVRDLSLDCRKQTQLIVDGEGVEVDTTVAEYLRDPLVHMVRNAIYHGIEVPITRLKQGKHPMGRVTLTAAREAGRIRVIVEDDGAGLDRDKIYNKAVKNGLVPPGQELSDNQVYQLIFTPGFSTAEQKNEISGRGVGMDVVQRNLEILRGRIRVESKKGEGSRFILTMPLTLAIIDGFRVGVGNETYVIPLESVRECIELPDTDKEPNSKWGITNLRGKPLPFLYLKRVFKLESSANARENLIVVGYGDKQAGIVVDRLLGEAQTVIKPLGKLFQDINGITGSTILGNGRVAFVLDVATIVARAIDEMEKVASEGKDEPQNQEYGPSSIFEG